MLLKKLVLALFAFALWLPSASALEFAVLKDSSDRNVLFVFGSIAPDDAENFQKAASRVQNLRGFWLSSGGGAVHASFQIGRIIRQSRLPVTVPSLARLETAIRGSGGNRNVLRAGAHMRGLQANRRHNMCASACGLLLAGGVLRFVDEAGTVGLHSASALSGRDGELADNGQITREEAQRIERQNQGIGLQMSRYMQEMGISLTYIDVAARVPSRCMFFLSEYELDLFNVANVRGNKPESTSRRAGQCFCSGGSTREENVESSNACQALIFGE